MLEISDSQFDAIISQVLDELPQEYIKNMKNVAIVMADDPDDNQRQKLKLRCHDTLFGLYEGIPLTGRGAGYNLVLPDKITLFKNPLMSVNHDIESFTSHVKHTLWHEIAHHYGLNHDRIHEIERTRFKE